MRRDRWELIERSVREIASRVRSELDEIVFKYCGDFGGNECFVVLWDVCFPGELCLYFRCFLSLHSQIRSRDVNINIGICQRLISFYFL